MHSCFAALVPFAVLIALPLHAETIAADRPQSVLNAMRDYGVAATLEVDDEGDPVIRTKIAGTNTSIYFYGCEDNGKDCRSISFGAGFETDSPFTLKDANQWNAEKRFSKAYVNDEGAARIEMDVNLMGGGVSAESFADTVDWWDYSITEFKTFINW